MAKSKGIELLAENGLKVSNLLWAGGFTGDGHSYQESIDDARGSLAPGRGVGHQPPGRLQRLPQRPHAQSCPAAIHQRPGELLPLAEQLEDRAGRRADARRLRRRVDVSDHAGRGVELLRDLNSPSLKLVFDTYHLGHDPDVLSQIAAVARTSASSIWGTANAPPREQNRNRLGEGIMPLSLHHQGIEAGGLRRRLRRRVDRRGDRKLRLSPACWNGAKQSYERLVLA